MRAIGLIAGGMLTQWASWRWVLFVNVPIGLAVYLAGRAVLAETARKHGRFDLAGAFTSTFGMGALVYGFVRAASDGWSDTGTVGSFVAGVLLLAAFVVVELRAEEPITPLRLLANASRSGANVARGLLFAGMFGMFFFLTQFLQDVLGYSPLQAGFRVPADPADGIRLVSAGQPGAGASGQWQSADAGGSEPVHGGHAAGHQAHRGHQLPAGAAQPAAVRAG